MSGPQSPSSFPSGSTLRDESLDRTIEAERTWPRNPRAYLALAGCFFCMFNSWGIVNAYGTFASYYEESLLLGSDVLLLNLIGSTECFVVLFFSFIVGRLLDAGYYRYLTGTGWALVSIGMFTLSQTAKRRPIAEGGRQVGDYALIWLTQGLTTGLGMACLFVSSSQIVSTWFIKRKSFAIGIVACGASIAGVVYPVATRYLIKMLNWEKAMYCVAAIACVTGLFTLVAATPNPHHKIRKPETWLSKEAWVDTHAFQHVPYRWFVASISILFFGFYAVFFNLEEWSVTKGVGYKDGRGRPVETQHVPLNEKNPRGMRTFYLLCIMNGASSLGRLSAAYLSDHFGALNVHSIVTFSSSILVLSLWTLTDRLSEAITFVILFGAVSGAVIGLPPASVANILGHCPTKQAKLGQWTGMMYTAAAPFALTGPVIAGHLASTYGTYLTVQLWSGVCLLLSSICMGFAIWYGREEMGMMRGRKKGFGESMVSSMAVSGVTTRRPSQEFEEAEQV